MADERLGCAGQRGECAVLGRLRPAAHACVLGDNPGLPAGLPSLPGQRDHAAAHCIDGRDDLISQQIKDALDPDSGTPHLSQCVTASGYTHRRYRPDPVRHMSVNDRSGPGMARSHPSSHAGPSPEDGSSDDCLRSSEGGRIDNVR